MNNLLLPQKEKKLATALGLLPALVILIIFYILKLIAKVLNKWKKQVYKASLAIFVIYGLVSFFVQVVDAPKADASQPYVSIVQSPKTEKEEIAAYIQEVFGKEAPKAFRLLIECGKNASLNPDAVNTAGNFPVGSRDIGVFQINEHWQKVQGKFLFNWKINVEIAHQLYVENGNSFKLWTGGRKCGI